MALPAAGSGSPVDGPARQPPTIRRQFRPALGLDGDVTAVFANTCADVVLDVEAACCALEATSAAARNDLVVTLSANLCAIGCKLRVERVGGEERSLWTSIETANDDLLTDLEVCATRGGR